MDRAWDILKRRLVKEATDLGLGIAVVPSLREDAEAQMMCAPRRQVLDPERVDELMGYLNNPDS